MACFLDSDESIEENLEDYEQVGTEEELDELLDRALSRIHNLAEEMELNNETRNELKVVTDEYKIAYKKDKNIALTYLVDPLIRIIAVLLKRSSTLHNEIRSAISNFHFVANDIDARLARERKQSGKMRSEDEREYSSSESDRKSASKSSRGSSKGSKKKNRTKNYN